MHAPYLPHCKDSNVNMLIWVLLWPALMLAFAYLHPLGNASTAVGHLVLFFFQLPLPHNEYKV